MTDVFISYSSRCPVYADMIEEDLERDGYSAWRDRSKLKGGDKWKREIQNAIGQSTMIVVLVTKPALRSKWIKYELDYAASLHRTRIPLIMEGLKETGEALRQLGVDEDQAISFVERGRRVAYAELLDCVKKYTDEWRPLASSISNLNHFSSHVRQKAVDDLANSKDPRVLPYLQTAFEVEDQHTLAQHILSRLSEFNDQRVVQLAIDILERHSDHLYFLYFEDSARLILQRWGPYYSGISELLLDYLDIPEVIDFVGFSLRNFDKSVQKQAIEKLSQKILNNDLGAPASISALAQLSDLGLEILKNIMERPDFRTDLKEHARNQILWNSRKKK